MPRSRRCAGNHAGEKDRRVTRGRINCSGMLVRCHTLRGHGVGEGGIPIGNMEACTVFASISQLKVDTASMIRAVCFLTREEADNDYTTIQGGNSGGRSHGCGS